MGRSGSDLREGNLRRPGIHEEGQDPSDRGPDARETKGEERSTVAGAGWPDQMGAG